MQPAGWRHDEPIGEQPRQLEAPAGVPARAQHYAAVCLIAILRWP
jgi:hypothetical protein